MKDFLNWFTDFRSFMIIIAACFIGDIANNYISPISASVINTICILMLLPVIIANVISIYNVFSKRRKFYKTVQAQNCAMIKLAMCEDEEEKKNLRIRIDALEKMIKKY